MTRFATFENNERRQGGSQRVTGAEVNEYLADDPKRVITTDSEKSLVARQASHVKQIELRTYVFLDSLQLQVQVFYPYLVTLAFGWRFLLEWLCTGLQISHLKPATFD